tara:strand:+ start:3133 stop:3939 length:807 start_codon:yes stop_codon:yes gene_type:complete
MEPIYTFTNSPIIVTDLDGTILENGKVSNEISSIFNKLHKLGIPITFATGRSKIPASQFAKLLKLKLPYICSGGSIISDPETDVDIYEKEIDIDTFVKITNEIAEFKNLNIALYSLKDIYVQNEFKWITDYSSRQNIKLFKKDNLNLINKKTVLLIIGDPFDIDKITIRLKNKYSNLVEINKTFENLCEVSSLEGNKLNSTKVLLNLLNLSKSDLFYFGDGEADIDLLKYAKYGYAVKGSVANTKLSDLETIDIPEKSGFCNFINSIT